MKNRILIVDDNDINRALLHNMLRLEYDVLQASDGIEALEIIKKHHSSISAIVLDLFMPKMDGRELLKVLSQEEKYSNLPVLIAKGDHDAQIESECLELGAWDFVTKPYNPVVIRLRLNNIIGKSQIHLLKKIQDLAEHDTLTGLYNRQNFMKCTSKLLREHESDQFILIRLDIDHFKLYNASFGSQAGDELLQNIANEMKVELSDKCTTQLYSYGRIESDVFGMCLLYQKDKIERGIAEYTERVRSLCDTYRLELSWGLYVIEDHKSDMEEMYSYTVEASQKCKNNVNVLYAYYDSDMRNKEQRAQQFVNEMKSAIEEEQFKVYLQPKYSIEHDSPCGAEALVRWVHPEWGMVSPGEFIPAFEQNGLIVQLDYYMWEHVCRILRKWLDQSGDVYPG